VKVTQQQSEVTAAIESLAEEQVLFLKSRYKMEPADIINLYTGEKRGDATYSDAISSIVTFNVNNAQHQGFIA
jgi:hypothetical protein